MAVLSDLDLQFFETLFAKLLRFTYTHEFGLYYEKLNGYLVVDLAAIAEPEFDRMAAKC